MSGKWTCSRRKGQAPPPALSQRTGGDLAEKVVLANGAEAERARFGCSSEDDKQDRARIEDAEAFASRLALRGGTNSGLKMAFQMAREISRRSRRG